MQGLARHVTVWVVAAVFAVASVAWAATGLLPQSPAAVVAIDHGDHMHSAVGTDCANEVACPVAADHSHDADSSCCAFACHVVADIPCGTLLIAAVFPLRHDEADPVTLIGAVPAGHERPPRRV